MYIRIKKIEKLEETNRRVEDFLANVSHELRTPINAVTGIYRHAAKKKKSKKKREQLSSVQMAGKRLFGQIEDILDYTEIDTNKIPAERRKLYTVSGCDLVSSIGKKKKNRPNCFLTMIQKIPPVLFSDERKIRKDIKNI